MKESFDCLTPEEIPFTISEGRFVPNPVKADGEFVGAPEPVELAPLTQPADFKAALALVQRLQKAYELAPGATRKQQAYRSALGIQLETAKRFAKDLQQGPQPPHSDSVNSQFVASSIAHPKPETIERVRRSLISR